MLLVLLRRRKKKNDRTLQTSSEPNVETPENPNNTSISDAETQSGDEYEPDEMLIMMFM